MHIEISAFGYELYFGPRGPGPLERLTPVLLSLIPLVLGGARPSAAKVEREDDEERDDEPTVRPLNETLEQIAAERIEALENKVDDLRSMLYERTHELRALENKLASLISRADLEPVLVRFTALEDKVKGLAAYIPSPAPRA